MPTLVSRCLNWLAEGAQWAPVRYGCQSFTRTHSLTHCICYLTKEWCVGKWVQLDPDDAESDVLKGVTSHSHLPSQLGASGFLVVRYLHSWFWVLSYECRPIKLNSCYHKQHSIGTAAFWTKLFTIQRYRELIWHSVASQVAQQSTETALRLFGGHANKVDIWSCFSFLTVEKNAQLLFYIWRSVLLHYLLISYSSYYLK